MLDVRRPEGHGIIGDRAFAAQPGRVAQLGRATCAGLLAGGVLPVIKHIPGHGRAALDSHEALPVVNAGTDELRALDFQPFAALADMPLAMTAHVVYAAFDRTAPATTSATVIREVVRGAIGFDGLLMSDDLCMRALTGTPGERARAALAAGCDVLLHCNGDLTEMEAIAEPVRRCWRAARAGWRGHRPCAPPLSRSIRSAPASGWLLCWAERWPPDG
ncbi:MAG: glycoside hydrolase family 3 N-terminal domain-containing protein [Rhodospirillales bacterium]